MKIVIAGGAGFIGRRVAERLARNGRDLFILTRGSSENALSKSAKIISWNPAADGPWRDAVGGADAVINLCGAGVADARWTAARKSEILSSRVNATRALVENMRGGQVLVNASAVGYYGSSGSPVDEKSPRGDGFLANVCAQWEAEAQKAEAKNVRTAVIRLGVVLGRGGALAKMRLPFKLGLGGRLGSGRQAFPWIHAEDAAALFETATADARYRGPINGVAPDAVDNAGFTKTFARVLKRPAIFPVPAFALRVLLGEMAGMLLEGRSVAPAAALAQGFRFQFPKLEDALRDLTL